MTFKSRKIRQKPRPKPLKKLKQFGEAFKERGKQVPSKTINYIVASFLVVLGTLVVGKVSVATYHFVADFSVSPVSAITNVIGKDLRKDDNDYTNILLLGDGGFDRDGAGLLDTIMVASIDYEKNAVSLLSVPRDYYVDQTNNLGLTRTGSRINQIYVNYGDIDNQDERYKIVKEAVGELMNLDIQYYMRTDFQAFVEVVDSIGGITVEVPKAIYDSQYPNANDNGYDPFSIAAGLQEMDGETALKYARSRKSTSDYDRSARQQLILEGIQQKILSKETLTSLGTITDLYNSIQSNINTDMSLRELAALAGFAYELDRSHIVMKQLHTNTTADGGFLYDGSRAIYGAAVVLPEGNNLDLIHKYADLIFNHRELYYQPATIEVLNASQYPGVASEVGYELSRFGFQVENVDNLLDEVGERQYLENTLIRYHDWNEDEKGLITAKFPSTLAALNAFIKGQEERSDQGVIVSMPEEKIKRYEGGAYDVSVIIGNDYELFL